MSAKIAKVTRIYRERITKQANMAKTERITRI